MFFMIFLTAAILLAVFSHSIIKFYIPSLSEEKLLIASTIFRIFIFTLPLTAGISVLSAYLQAEFKFAHPALSQLLLNIGVIVLVVLSYNRLDIWSIPVSYLGGTIIQFGYLLYYSRLKIRFNSFIIFRKNGSIVPSNTFILVILIEAVSQLYLICDRYFYTSVDSGGIAALNYAMIIYILPISIISYAISTVIFPQMTIYFVEKRIMEIQSSLKKYLSGSIYIFLPMSFILFFWGDALIHIFFQRGKFNSLDTIVTFKILKIYSISLIFYSCYSIINKVIYSLGLVKQLLLLTITGIIIKAILNVLFVGVCRQNGLALSTTLTYIYFFTGGFYLVSNKIKIKEDGYFLKELLFNILNGFICYALVVILIPSDKSVVAAITCIISFSGLYFLNSIILSPYQFQFLRKVLNYIGVD
jgi:putative peptidoglycan lipid II flippase